SSRSRPRPRRATQGGPGTGSARRPAWSAFLRLPVFFAFQLANEQLDLLLKRRGRLDRGETCRRLPEDGALGRPQRYHRAGGQGRLDGEPGLAELPEQAELLLRELAQLGDLQRLRRGREGREAELVDDDAPLLLDRRQLALHPGDHGRQVADRLTVLSLDDALHGP